MRTTTPIACELSRLEDGTKLVNIDDMEAISLLLAGAVAKGYRMTHKAVTDKLLPREMAISYRPFTVAVAWRD